MAIKYFVEADEDLEMDVQVGPEEEIEAAPDDKANEIADPVVPEVKEEEGVQLNPVEIAKKSPETVCVGCKIENVDDKEIREFYVDARDVEKYADLNEKSFLESLNDIILANEGSGMGADNIVVVMDESTSCYTRTLEKNGAACVFVNEAVEDIEMDVQVGPDKEEESVKADPQEANPVDAVKRQYGSVVVANQGDEFFMDVEDVQKCAELNCESVIKTLNKIIDVNEQFDMNTENIRIICNESMTTETVEAFDEAGVQYIFEGATPEEKSRKAMIKKAGKVVKSFLYDQGCMKVDVSTLYIGGQNAAFVKGTDNTILVGISSKAANRAAMIQAAGGYSYSNARDEDKALDAIEAAAKIVKEHKKELIKDIEEAFKGFKVKDVKTQPGRIGVTNVAITFAK